MKRLFVIDNEYNIDLNKEWLHLVPEFAVILHRVWKCEGDSDGRKKLMQLRIFGYIYLTVDFGSHLFTWDTIARENEAMKMMQLKSGDLDHPTIGAAIRKYNELQQECSPKLKALRGMHSALEKMNNTLETMDLEATDKQGKLLYTPSSITRAMKEINAAYDALETMERRVMEELKKEGGNTIRGTATLGGREGKRQKEWKEGTGPGQTEIQKSIEHAVEDGKDFMSIDSSPDFRQIGNYLKTMTGDDDEQGGDDVS